MGKLSDTCLVVQDRLAVGSLVTILGESMIGGEHQVGFEKILQIYETSIITTPHPGRNPGRLTTMDCIFRSFIDGIKIIVIIILLKISQSKDTK